MLKSLYVGLNVLFSVTASKFLKLFFAINSPTIKESVTGYKITLQPGVEQQPQTSTHQKFPLVSPGAYC